MTNKSDVLSIFIKWQKYVERYFNQKIKMVQSDWGGEYRSLHKFLQICGITHRVCCPHTHQQNGVVECKRCHVVETGLTLPYHAKIHLQFWDDAFQTACYLINRLPTSTIKNLSPFEKLFNQALDYNFLRVFGLASYAHLINDVLLFSSLFSELSYSHIRRDGNKIVHSLVGLALISPSCTVWMEDIPFRTLPFVHADLVAL